jgi:molybdopterin/thiamine biosynthesis adenylyltransferase
MFVWINVNIKEECCLIQIELYFILDKLKPQLQNLLRQVIITYLNLKKLL